jgi:transcriptional regulator with XRE-family HTH domain
MVEQLRKFGATGGGTLRPLPKLNGIDVLLGENTRARRLAANMPEQALAEHLRVSCRQLQEYEGGTKGFGARRLWQIAAALEVAVAELFRDND